MFMSKVLFAIAVVGLSGCGRKGDDTSSTGTETGDTSVVTDDTSSTVTGDVEPVDGTYTITSMVGSNGCGNWAGTFNQSVNGRELDLSFPTDDSAVFHWPSELTCSRDGATVTCATDEPLVLDDYAPDNDAVIMYEDATTLEWSTSTTAAGQWIVDLSCIGEQCEIVAEINHKSYPCEIVFDWTLEAQ
jgi:hypothetical protein